MCATGAKPIVEVQFADYIYPAFNQLVTEIAKSFYLSNGKFPVIMTNRFCRPLLSLRVINTQQF